MVVAVTRSASYYVDAEPLSKPTDFLKSELQSRTPTWLHGNLWPGLY
jgi:hypothetical protein